MIRVQKYGWERTIQFVWRGREVWLYAGRSFSLDRVVQRQRVSRNCGYVQLAYGNVQHYGRRSKRTVGLSYAGSWAS